MKLRSLALGLTVLVMVVPSAAHAAATTTHQVAAPDTYFCTATTWKTCDQMRVTMTLDKEVYTPGETVKVTGRLSLFNSAKAGSNDLLTYYSPGFTWELNAHKASVAITAFGQTKQLFAGWENFGGGTPTPSGGCKTSSCPAAGEVTFTAPTTPGDYVATCDAYLELVNSGLGTPGEHISTIPVSVCRLSFRVGTTEPDLIAGAINEQTAIAGAAKIFSALITNQGTASTTSLFYNRLQRATSCDVVADTAVGAAMVNHKQQLSPLGPFIPSTTFSFNSYTIPATDANTTRCFRACADLSTGGLQFITESNEANNCGRWTQVAISASGSEQADIIATNTQGPSVSPAVGGDVYFTAQAKNIGTAAAAPVPNAFRIAFNSAKTGPYAWRAATQVSSLAASNGVANITSSSPFSTSTPGTYYVQACGNYNVTGNPASGTRNAAITESSIANNCDNAENPWVPVIVTQPPAAGKPDFTAGSVLQSSATVGVTQDFSADITNIGDTAATDPFFNLLQRTNAIDAQRNATGPVSDLQTGGFFDDVPASGSVRPALSYAFVASDAGTTRYLRMCADKNTSTGVGSITESNEENNCGDWTAVAVAAAPTGNLDVPDAPCTITSGNSSCTLMATWSATNATAPTIRNQVTNTLYTLTGTTGGTRSLLIPGPPGINMNFDLRSTLSGVTTILDTDSGSAACANGTAWSSGRCSAYQCTGSVPSGAAVYSGDTTSLTSTLAYQYAPQPGTSRKCEYYCSTGTVYDAGACISPPETDLDAAPLRVPKGSNTRLDWSGTNGATCSVSRDPSVSPWPLTGNPGTYNDPVTAQVTYTATCSNAAGSDTESVIVNILPDFQQF